MNTDKFHADRLDNDQMARLGACGDVDELGDVLQAVCDSAGIRRYAIVRIVGVGSPRIAQLMHNADDDATEFIEDAAKLSSWRVLQEVRKHGRPMLFGMDGQEAGPAGFGRGVAALANKSRSKCIAILGCDGVDIEPDAGVVLMSAAMIMAAHVHDSLEAIHIKQCPLTRQELVCVAHALAGDSAKETARKLSLGVRTVEEYLARARSRLAAPSSMAAGIMAVDHGWITLDQVRKAAA
jgi:DNA-binding CsgD family transcriptional regulator